MHEKSIGYISKQLGLKKPTIIGDKLRQFNIKIRPTSESKHTKHYIKITKQTCNRKYGADYHTCKHSTKRQQIDNAVRIKHNVDNVFQLQWVKDVIKKTCLQRYNVQFASQSQEFKQKLKETCLKKYGVDNVRKCQEIIDKILHTKFLSPKSYTQSSKKEEQLIKNILNYIDDTEKIHYQIKGKQFGVMSNQKKYYFYDFVDTKNKKCIQFNGNYYHANPKFYNKDWINKKIGQTAETIWLNQQKKLNAIKDRGFDVLVIWQDEYDNNKEGTISLCVQFLKGNVII